MLFVDHIMLVAETKEAVNIKLEEWRAVLIGKGLCISRMMTKYLRCYFNGTSLIGEPKVTIGDEVAENTTKFKYLGSII